MHHLPTRIAGVEILREPDSEPLKNRSHQDQPPALISAHPFAQVLEGDAGFTCELQYARQLPVTRCLQCLAGEVFVAVADVRVGSATFGHWQGFYLREGDARTLLLPMGVACGWQVTSGTARLEQRASLDVHPQDWRWLRWNDLELAITWPEIPETLGKHQRPSRSLATLPDRRLPKMNASLRRQTATSTNRKSPGSPAQQLKKNTTDAKATPQARKTRVANYRDELILVIGSSGQLGRDLCRHLSKLGTVVGACREPERGSLLPVPVQVDVSRPASIRQAIRRVKPTLIVNASGLTDLEKAESEPRLAQLVNATAPALMADEAKHIGASIVHFCSDMVFDGSGERPWREADLASPINQYGRTKLLGTEAIRNSGVPHLIIRSGWLYSPHGSNYITRLVDLLTYRNSIKLAADQFGSPTSTDWLAQVTCQLLTKSKGNSADWLHANGGLFHVAPLGYASRLDVGDQVVATCRAHALPIVSSKLQSGTLESMSSRPALPANCRLDCTKLAVRFGLALPRWQQQLNEQLSSLLSSAALTDRHVA